MKKRKLLCILLALVLAFCLTMSVYAAPQSDTAGFVQNILDYYRCYQTEAWEEIQVWLKVLEFSEPEQAAAWNNIMECWRWVDEDMDIFYDVLPDDLPEDNSLAIVVMGFALNSDGTMRQELVDRLTVALNSARKYPNAYVICTGGGTAAKSDNTEASEMAAWLLERGMEPERLIVEESSYSTIHNALYSYDLILREYPRIQSFAVVTSDYHIGRSVLFFDAVPEYAHAVEGTRIIPVVGSACCLADPTPESPSLLADGLAYMAGIKLDLQKKPALFSES